MVLKLFRHLELLGVDHECDGQTDGQTEWSSAVACSNIVRRALKMQYLCLRWRRRPALCCHNIEVCARFSSLETGAMEVKFSHNVHADWSQFAVDYFLANVNSLYVIVRPSVRLSVCRLSSVAFVDLTQAIKIFGNVSTPCGTLAIHDLWIKILRSSSQGNPFVSGGLNPTEQ